MRTACAFSPRSTASIPTDGGTTLNLPEGAAGFDFEELRAVDTAGESAVMDQSEAVVGAGAIDPGLRTSVS
jgi:hypothetical protein